MLTINGILWVTGGDGGNGGSGSQAIGGDGGGGGGSGGGGRIKLVYHGTISTTGSAITAGPGPVVGAGGDAPAPGGLIGTAGSVGNSGTTGQFAIPEFHLAAVPVAMSFLLFALGRRKRKGVAGSQRRWSL